MTGGGDSGAKVDTWRGLGGRGFELASCTYCVTAQQLFFVVDERSVPPEMMMLLGMLWLVIIAILLTPSQCMGGKCEITRYIEQDD